MIKEQISLDILECNKCELAGRVINKVVGRGTSENPSVLFIGEAPGNEENKTGQPFVGRSGKVLDDMIKYMDIVNYVIVNRLKCQPFMNANPTPDQLKACHPFLLRQIEYYNPTLIILLGNFANKGFGPKLDWGEIQFYKDRYYCKLYHPAALLYQSNNKKPQAEYMDKIIKMMEG